MKVNVAIMRQSADQAAEFLKSLGNRHRLLILCQLLDAERSVTDLSQFLAIRDSTVSQHLALLRREGLVKARRDGQTIWYSLNSDPAREILAVLYRRFCAPGESSSDMVPAVTVSSLTASSATSTAGRSRRTTKRNPPR
jgi:DNA-binding transcriptional ArsR family regulator